ncbi:hypothetical protein ES708_21578 [subsurface metagenome]
MDSGIIRGLPISPGRLATHQSLVKAYRWRFETRGDVVQRLDCAGPLFCGLGDIGRRSSANNCSVVRSRLISCSVRLSIDLLSRNILHSNIRGVRIERSRLSEKRTAQLKRVVYARNHVVIDGDAGDGDLLFRPVAVVGHELDETEFLDGPDVAAEARDGLFIGVQENEVPVLEAC